MLLSLIPAFDINIAAVLDSVVVLACAALLYKHARLTSIHPGSMYLIFHLMFFTARLYSVAAGSPTLFSDYQGATAVSVEEIAWAGVWADVGLISFTIGLIICARRNPPTPSNYHSATTQSTALLSRNVIQWVSLVGLPIGVGSLLVGGAIPNANGANVDFGQWSTSSWLMVTQFWPVLILLALTYFSGFQAKFVIPLGLLLLLMSIQGFNRFRVLLPIIFLLITWQTRVGSRWPRKWMVAALLCLTILFFPMKQLGWMVQGGHSLSDTVDVVSESFSEVIHGTSPDQQFLDMFACTIWLVDEHDHYFYGSTIFPLIFLPVPRQLWPEKPSLVEYLYEIRNKERPMYWAGMTPTLLGESYANFGLAGIAVIPLLVGYGLGKFYFVAMHRPYYSVFRFTYAILGCCLLEIFRDGFLSLIVFPVVNMMPLVAIAVLSYISFRRRQKGESMFAVSAFRLRRNAARSSA
jgi:oligosaccharide repeat unit polymerase